MPNPGGLGESCQGQGTLQSLELIYGVTLTSLEFTLSCIKVYNLLVLFVMLGNQVH